METREDQHTMLWRPSRCEAEGCKATKLKKCSGCKMVKYCGKEHQLQNWAMHKRDCKKYQELHLHARFYNIEDQLRNNPIGNLTVSTGDKRCGICGSTRKLIKTECCSNWVCNTEDEYVMFSYSRAHCSRSHRRYTLCEGTDHQHEDWRTCTECIKEHDVADAMWRGLNGYNFLPMLNVPYAPMTVECYKCKRGILQGWEAFSSTGFDDNHKLRIICGPCMTIQMPKR